MLWNSIEPLCVSVGVRKRGRGVQTTESCPCCQDLAIVLDRDYSEPLVFAGKKKKIGMPGLNRVDSSRCSIEREGNVV